VFSLERLLLGREANGCPISKRVCSSPLHGGTGKQAGSTPSRIACRLPPSTAQRRNAPDHRHHLKKNIFAPFKPHLTYLCHSLDQILPLCSSCRVVTQSAKAEPTPRHPAEPSRALTQHTALLPTHHLLSPAPSPTREEKRTSTLPGAEGEGPLGSGSPARGRVALAGTTFSLDATFT